MVHESDETEGNSSETKRPFYGRKSLLVSDDVESEDDSKSRLLENRNWSWGYMKKELKDRNLESLYLRYHQILHKGYFSVFLLLQVILTIVHVTCLLVREVDDPQHRTLPDIISYVSFTLLLWPLVALVFNKSLVKKFPSLPHVVSCFAIAIVVIVDIALPIYHTSLFHSRTTLRPAYATHALLACYIFLPLNNSITPVILGLGITSTHLVTLVMVTYRNSTIAHRQIASEAIFLVCVNVLGLYYRFINEMVIRRTFLDRRACVEFTMKLNYEKEQEEQLLLSILPWHIAARVGEDIRKKNLQLNKAEEPMTKKPFKELYIEKHDNVSILYADVVNYTKMTSSLPVTKLVETLNELFGKFDEASEKHKVLRIKFLGDCYYCASGIPQPNPFHAKSCVDLALDMISIIKEVRQERKLDIDMRIGVHSGSILSGLLGRCKWQYDIWSKDVVIANRMEQSGKPGMVHVTKQTLDQLGDGYHVEPGSGHLRDELLAKYNIRTYLIRPQQEVVTDDRRSSIYVKRESFGPRKSKTNANNQSKHGADLMYSLQGVISGDGNMAVSRRRTAFMNNNLIMYKQRLKMADAYMEEAIDNLPLGKYKWFQNASIDPLCLTFREKRRWEWSFMKQPDPLFKFYVISALFVSLCMSAIQFLGIPRLHLISWLGFAVSTTGLILLVPLTWGHYIWNAFKDPKRRLDQVPEPDNKILLLLYKGSVKIIWSCYLRTFLYFVVCFLLTLCSLADMINDFSGTSYCSERRSSINVTPTLEAKTLVAECRNESPWQLTESCSLAILMSFLFLRIHFQLKLLVGMCILGVYSWCIICLEFEVTGEETWNPNLEPKIAHILSLVFIVVGLHLMDRQAEYMNRLDYLWKKKLCNEKDEAEKTRSVNLMLLNNILPIHVAKVYLNTNRASNDLYHENYDCVAVMFASITNYCLYDDKDLDGSEIRSLEILNQVICEFDDALFESKFKTVEKIKVAGSTYMAACGLHPGQRDSNCSDGSSSTKVILTLVDFATTVMRRLQKVNREFNTDFRLRVGVSHGPVTAGVVGSQKPLYDIWGNAVNIASRMDSTGEPGKIQVTASTAAILQDEGIDCILRGPTFVKGKGIMETYFIGLTSDFYLRRTLVKSRL